MSNKIKTLIAKLEAKSQLEKSKKTYIKRENRMLAITRDTGQFFNILIKTSNFTRILEIGTSVGYSTLWFAEAVLENNQKKGQIITVEKSPVKVKRARENFEKVGISRFVKIKNGSALQIIPEISEKIAENKMQKFDFVFIDADKENMIKYFDLVLPIVKINGIIAADNILYPEKFRPLMVRYTKHVHSKKNVQSVTVPIGNGEEISLKISD